MTSYASLQEFYRFGLPSSVCDGLDGDAIMAAGEAAHDLIDGYFRAAGIDLPLPTASVTDQIKRVECHIRAYDVLGVGGYEPGTNPDTIIGARYAAAIRWLEQVVAGKIQPLPVDENGNPEDADPDEYDSGAAVATDTPRGWGLT